MKNNYSEAIKDWFIFEKIPLYKVLFSNFQIKLAVLDSYDVNVPAQSFVMKTFL